LNRYWLNRYRFIPAIRHSILAWSDFVVLPDHDFHLDSHRRGVGGRYAEAETCAVNDTRRYRHADEMPEQGVTSAAAGEARLGPGFPATAADPARAPELHFDRHNRTVERLARGERYVGRDRIVVFALAEKCIANPLDQWVDGREIDGDFVGETIV
jgi:hypothetical protein